MRQLFFKELFTLLTIPKTSFALGIYDIQKKTFDTNGIRFDNLEFFLFIQPQKLSILSAIAIDKQYPSIEIIALFRVTVGGIG